MKSSENVLSRFPLKPMFWIVATVGCLVFASSLEASSNQLCVPKGSGLSACPLRGCEKQDTSRKAIANHLKRNTTVAGTPKQLTFDDLEHLQLDLEELVATSNKKKSTAFKWTQADRTRLRKLPTKGVGEGSHVEIIGFLAAEPESSNLPTIEGGESVNCKLPGDQNRDFHINVAPSRGGSEFEGIVVEMIPQQRNPKWTIQKLQRIKADGLQVRVRGRLFYDDAHRKNPGTDPKAKTQPKRFSLWEVHPVREFDVCPTATCGGSDWVPLAQWAPKG